MQLILLFLYLVLEFGLQRTSGDETRVACPVPGSNGLQCSNDCKSVGYCLDNKWTVLDQCTGNTGCDPDNPNDLCNGISISNCPNPWNEAVVCIETGINVPNLEDPTCSSFYTCGESSALSMKLAGVGKPKYCDNRAFDPCSGECISNFQCPSPFSCTNEQAFTPLSSNKKYAYGCLNVGSASPFLVWKFCESGVYDQEGQQCNDEANYDCNVKEVCTEPGITPYPDSNCKYCLCLADLTCKVIACADGYYYSYQDRKCILGECYDT